MAVQDVIAQQQQFATETIASADALLSKIDSLTSNFFLVDPPSSIPDPGYATDSTEATQALLLGLFPSVLDVGEITQAQVPEFTSGTIDTIPDVAVPDFTGVAPSLNIPQAPSAALPVVPVAPAVDDPSLPDVPTITFPAVPSITGITFPDVPGVEIPVFSTTLPVDDLVVPSNTFTFFEELYASASLDALQAKLLADMQNGGYGIETNDEAALWDRARSRELEGALAESETLIAEAAARGFPLPPGDLTIALQRANQKLQDKMSGVNRDIALKRADLYVENRKFTIEQTRQLEQVLIGFHNSIMERSLNSAKAVMEASIQIFNAQVAKYNAQLDAYKTDAAAFESRVRAQMVRVEIYRTQMEGKRIEVDVQRATVEVYNAQLAGINAVIGLYRARVEAVQALLGVNRLRVETFRALIDAYGAQVQAKTAEFGMFKSRIDGEVARVTAFESESRAYAAVISGTRAKVDVLTARLDAQVKAAQQIVEVYRADLEKYRTDVTAQAQLIDARVRVYGGQVQAGAAESGAVAEARRLDLTSRTLDFQRAAENAKLVIERAKVTLAGLVASADAQVKAAVGGAGYYQAVVGAAVNSINTLTALTATE